MMVEKVRPIDLEKPWAFIEPRDKVEDVKLWEEIEALGLPQKVFDVHVHAGLKQHVEDISVSRLASNKALNNRQWYHLSRIKGLHRIIFFQREVEFAVFPMPFSETNVIKANKYLLKNVTPGEYVISLGNPDEDNLTIQTIEANREKIVGVKMYPDQKISSNLVNPDELSIFDFFPKDILTYLNDIELPIILHLPRKGGLTNPETFEEVVELASMFSKIRIILAHMGRCYNPNLIGRTIEGIEPFQNILFESSMVDNEDVFENILRIVGHKRVMFGSDLPFSLVRFLRVLSGDKQEVLSKQESYAITIDEKPNISIGMNVLYMTRALLLACRKIGFSEKAIQEIFNENAKKILNI